MDDFKSRRGDRKVLWDRRVLMLRDEARADKILRENVVLWGAWNLPNVIANAMPLLDGQVPEVEMVGWDIEVVIPHPF
jgi:hypothetical protein